MFPVNDSLSGRWLFLASQLTIVSLDMHIDFVANGLFIETVDAVLHNDYFSIPSPNAYLVSKSVGIVSKWMTNNQLKIIKFKENQLHPLISVCHSKT